MLVSIRALSFKDEIVRLNGGETALGHPVGMSEVRIVSHGAPELRRLGGGIAAASPCGGGGQGVALLIRAPRK
jgi:acetyl-CoA C-acetyltransferase